MSSNIIPFGKYKGRTIEEVLTDDLRPRPLLGCLVEREHMDAEACDGTGSIGTRP